MRSELSQAPFVRYCPPFIAGIISGFHPDLQSLSLAVTAFVVFIFLTLYRFFIKKEKYNLRYRYGVLFSLFVFTSGWSLVECHDPKARYMADQTDIVSSEQLLVRVTQPSAEKTNSIKITGVLICGYQSRIPIPLGSPVLIYLEKDTASRQVKMNDFLLVTENNFRKIEGPANPFEFDFRKYTERKGIFYQMWAGSNHWTKVSSDHHTSFHKIFIECRESLIRTMETSGISGQELAVLSALVTGKTDEIDRELLTAYSGVGVVHVLAVSGMHVGLIYLVLMLFLRPFKYNRKAVVIHCVLSIVFLVFYAGITGFSASVNRSTLMFCMMIMASLIRRRNYIINSICASAFLLLLFDPYQLLDVGFQLSYLAVIGIVLLQKKIYRLFYFRHKIIDWMWELTAVSLAAQLATFPLCLFYFHQFPTWFVLSNLVIIPISTVLLYAAIVFYGLSWIPGVHHALANLCSTLTKVMNDLVVIGAKLPCSVIRGIWISIPETIFIYLLIISFCLWWFTKRWINLMIVMGFGIVLIAWNNVESVSEMQQERIIFHKVPRHTAITWQNGKKAVFLYSGKWKEDSASYAFHLQPFWDYLGDELTRISLDSLSLQQYNWIQRESDFLRIGEHVLMIADTSNEFTFNKPGSEIGRQILLVRQNSIRHREWGKIENDLIIFDNTCSPGYTKKAAALLNTLNSTIVDLSEGACIKVY